MAAARIAVARDALPGALSRIAWAGPVAHVWSWLPDDTTGARERAAWVPESLLRVRPPADGPRLVEQVEGVEGQVWRGGDLVASQWWPAAPPAASWHAFLRSASLGTDVAPVAPAPQALGWSRPWARLRGGGAARSGEGMAWRAAAVAIALTLGWQVAALESERDSLAVLEARTDALRSQAMPLLEARERADRARADIERYRLLQRGSSDYSLMAAVVVPLDDGNRLLSWHRQGEQLKARVAAEGGDPRAFVKAYDRVGLLSDVQAAPAGPAAMGLEFKLPDGFKAGTEK